MSDRGFILQPTYRIEAGRPVVHLYGKLATGETFLVRDDREVPHFYVEAADVERARRLGARRVAASDRRTMDGRQVARVEVRKPSDTPTLRDRLVEHGVACYEADVRFAMVYLISRGVRGVLAIDGRWQTGRGIDRVYRNPEVTAVAAGSGEMPELSVLSIDIETDPRARRLLSIALHGCGASEVLLLHPRGREVPAGAVPFAGERELLRAFCHRVQELDPDVLTGWNVVDFDLRVLDRLATGWRVPLRLGRGGGGLRLRRSRFPWATQEATIPGRVVLDGIHLLRGSFIKLDSYALDAVAREILGEGKTLAGGERGEEILETYRRDRQRFVDYNLNDARLALDVIGRLRLVELSVERSLLTGLPVDRVAGSIAAFDFLYLTELHRRGIVAPSVGASGATAGNPGGHVLEPESGVYENVLVCDFLSLYPSLIRTFQIDPLGYLPQPAPGDDAIVAPNGAAFRRRPGILTRLLDDLMPRREAAKAAGDKVASHAIKILMNSFYGVLGTPVCRFFRPQLAGAITTFGRDVLLWSKERLESYGVRVLYGDTDSLFVLSGEPDPERAWAVGKELVAKLNRDLAEHVERTFRVESRLELELEKLYRRLHLPAMRHGRGGARKRYAGLLADGEVEYVGMEVVRRDWTELAKRVQRQLYERLFHDQEVAGYLSLVVANLRRGRLDEHLVYRKGLGKPLDEYTATTPPHVVAARKLSRPSGRLVSYVMTRNGPEPAAEVRSPIDYEHYVQKQVRPVAEPVLEILGLDFDKAIGDDAQLELF